MNASDRARPPRTGFEVGKIDPGGNNVGLRLPATCPGPGVPPILPRMFVVSEEAAAAIRTAYEQDGELSAAIELRRTSGPDSRFGMRSSPHTASRSVGAMMRAGERRECADCVETVSVSFSRPLALRGEGQVYLKDPGNRRRRQPRSRTKG
jgi:hypothetical protein